MGSSIRDLFVSVTTKVDSGGLGALDKRIDGVKDKFGKFATFLAGGFIAKGVSDFIKGQLDAADHLNDTSQKLGIATDDLERFGFVAQLSGSSAEAMYGALNKMNKAIGDNSDGFSKLGVDLKNSDGTFRETGDVFLDVAENFNSLGSQGEKTAVAMKIFGKSGAELIPLLNQGGKGVQDLIDRFEELGGATPDDFIKSAAEINDKLDELTFVSNKAKQQLVGALLPGLLSLAKGFTNALAKVTSFEKRTHLITTTLKTVAGMFALLKLVSLAGNFLKAAKAVATLSKVFGGLKSVLMTGGLALAVLLIQDLITFATGGKSVIGGFLEALVGPEKASEFAKQLRDVWDQVATKILPQIPGILANIQSGLPGVINGFISFADALSRVVKLLALTAGGITDLKATKAAGSSLWSMIKGDKTRVISDEELEAKKRSNTRLEDLADVYDTNNFGGIKGTKAVHFEAPPTIPASAMSPQQGGVSAANAGWSVVGGGNAAPAQTTVAQTNYNTWSIAAPDPAAAAAAVKGALPDASKKMMRDAKGALASVGKK